MPGGGASEELSERGLRLIARAGLPYALVYAAAQILHRAPRERAAGGLLTLRKSPKWGIVFIEALPTRVHTWVWVDGHFLDGPGLLCTYWE